MQLDAEDLGLQVLERTAVDLNDSGALFGVDDSGGHLLNTEKCKNIKKPYLAAINLDWLGSRGWLFDLRHNLQENIGISKTI